MVETVPAPTQRQHKKRLSCNPVWYLLRKLHLPLGNRMKLYTPSAWLMCVPVGYTVRMFTKMKLCYKHLLVRQADHRRVLRQIKCESTCSLSQSEENRITGPIQNHLLPCDL